LDSKLVEKMRYGSIVIWHDSSKKARPNFQKLARYTLFCNQNLLVSDFRYAVQWYQNDIACTWDSSPVISYAKSGNENIDAMQKGNEKKLAG
jgi:hypothetical protein